MQDGKARATECYTLAIIYDSNQTHVIEEPRRKKRNIKLGNEKIPQVKKK